MGLLNSKLLVVVVVATLLLSSIGFVCCRKSYSNTVLLTPRKIVWSWHNCDEVYDLDVDLDGAPKTADSTSP